MDPYSHYSASPPWNHPQHPGHMRVGHEVPDEQIQWLAGRVLFGV